MAVSCAAGSRFGWAAQPKSPAETKSQAEPEPAANSTAEPTDEDGRQILRNSRKRMRAYSSIRAQIAETVSLGDHSFTAKGSYLQGQNLQLRLEFSLEYGGNQGSLLEICDGQLLWTRHDIAGEVHITRRDVRQILDAAQATASPRQLVIADLGLGGLPGLLAAIDDYMILDRVVRETIDGRPVAMVEGTWNSQFQAGFKGKNAKADDPLPPLVPDMIRIYFDQETEFPRRIAFLKQVPGRKIHKPTLTLDFTRLVLDKPINEGDFLFVPPDTPRPEDVTELFIQRIKGSGRSAAAGPPAAAGAAGPKP